MSDRPPTDQGQPVDSRRLSVRQAAAELDTTPDAIRARIRRGTLHGEKVGAEWLVILTSSGRAEEVGQPETVGETVADSRRLTPDSRATDPLIGHMQEEISYLRGLVAERDRALEERSRELATERERSDVLQQLALSRIPAVGAGDVPTHAPGGPGEPFEPNMADSPFTPNGAPQEPLRDHDVTILATQLIEELGMDPQAALVAAAAELGIAYGEASGP